MWQYAIHTSMDLSVNCDFYVKDIIIACKLAYNLHLQLSRTGLMGMMTTCVPLATCVFASGLNDQSPHANTCALTQPCER